MPSLEPSLVEKSIQRIEKLLTDFPVFIETGTFQGESSRAMSSLFPEVYTIEVDSDLYQKALHSFNGTNVVVLEGDSISVLKTLLPTVEKNTIFWLDGHYSGPGTGRGQQEFPLLEECRIIDSEFRGQEALILIDDMRLLGWKEIGDDGTLAATNIVTILKSFTKRNLLDHWYADSSIAEGDRLILHIR